MHKRKSNVALVAIIAAVGLFATAIHANAYETKWPEGCLVSQRDDGAVAARFVDPKTYQAHETIRIPADGDPIVERSGKARGVIRKNCEVMVLEVLGRARARQILRLSD